MHNQTKKKKSSNPFIVRILPSYIVNQSSLFILKMDHVAHKANPNSQIKPSFWQKYLLGIRNGKRLFICVVSNLHLYTGYGIGRAGAIEMTGG